jgi:hypothetical protein
VAMLATVARREREGLIQSCFKSESTNDSCRYRGTALHCTALYCNVLCHAIIRAVMKPAALEHSAP